MQNNGKITRISSKDVTKKLILSNDHKTRRNYRERMAEKRYLLQMIAEEMLFWVEDQ